MRVECEAIFLFIAELTGSFVPGSGDMSVKIDCGENDYIADYFPELDLRIEEDRKEAHVTIWLERLYNELDKYFELSENSLESRTLAVLGNYRDYSYEWTVPIELDASASMLQYESILLNDKRLMEMTNVIGDTLVDPWTMGNLARTKLKKAATPMLYGSSKTCHELWQDAKIDYSIDDIRTYNKELNLGPFGVAAAFKDFIIQNARPSAKMRVEIWNDTFTVDCNRFRYVGEETKAYKIWDSHDQRYNILLHTETTKVPDLEQFRRYFMTLLIHNLDSQVANTVAAKTMKRYEWTIPIHDAFLVSPAAAADVRRWYGEELKKIYENRKHILLQFFKSIGIKSNSRKQWQDLQHRVVPLTTEFKPNPMALK